METKQHTQKKGKRSHKGNHFFFVSLKWKMEWKKWNKREYYEDEAAKYAANA